MDEPELLRVRDEVLQALYWMRSEGIADAPTPAELARFLAVPAATLAVCLQRLAADGLIEASGTGRRLTEEGERLGKRSFADEVADMTRQGHGEGDEGRWGPES